jgi:hypothetical protein
MRLFLSYWVILRLLSQQLYLAFLISKKGHRIFCVEAVETTLRQDEDTMALIEAAIIVACYCISSAISSLTVCLEAVTTPLCSPQLSTHERRKKEQVIQSGSNTGQSGESFNQVLLPSALINYHNHPCARKSPRISHGILK